MARKLSTSRGSSGLPGPLLLCAPAFSGIAPPNAKLTTSMLPVRRKSRRFIAASSSLRGAKHRIQDSRVRGAPAKISAETLFDLFDGGMRCLVEKRFGRHHHAVRAVSALSGLFRDECGLDGIRFFSCAQSFDGCNGAPFCLPDGGDARPGRLPIDQNGASAALT